MCSIQLVNVINKACLFQDKEYECATVCLNKTKTKQKLNSVISHTMPVMHREKVLALNCATKVIPTLSVNVNFTRPATCFEMTQCVPRGTYSWWDMYVKCGINNSEQCEKTCWLMIAVLFPVTLMLYCSCLTAWRGNWYVMCTLPYICIHS